MSIRLIIAAGLLAGLAVAPGYAQTTPDTSATARSPTLGDPVSKPRRTHRSAGAIARADKQGPGTENGNQPDRASAGGGGR